MPSFKEEHILIVAPGSKTTLAQLGLPESFGPAAIRVPTRVFRDEADGGKYRPNKIRAKRVKVTRPAAAAGPTTTSDAPPPLIPTAAGVADGTGAADEVMSGTGETAQAVDGDLEEEITQYEEDADDEDGAIYPIVQGRIVDHEALRALLSHIDNLVSPPMHTPVLIVNDASWTQADKESVAQYYFEILQRPAISFLSSPLAVCAGFGTLDACVIDVGYEKISVSTVLGFNLLDDGVSTLNGIGGRAVNEALARARSDALSKGKVKGPQFTENMVEQLKKQPYICEVLQPEVPLPVESAASRGNSTTTNPAAAASTGVDADKGTGNVAATTGLPRGPGAGTQTAGEAEEGDTEGVLDVASIVASGKAGEILARREQERAAKAGSKKGGAGTDASKSARLTNAQKPKVPFRYTERVRASALQATGGKEEVDGALASNGIKSETDAGNAKDDGESYVYANREIEIGVERFAGCPVDTFLSPLALAVIDTISNAPADKRQDLWNSMAIVGNGSKVKGLKERILTHLVQTCVVAANNNTMFMSELPSQFSTPVATGANTPQPGYAGAAQQGAATPTPGGAAGGGSAVNPLLLAATTASQVQSQSGQLAAPGQPYQAAMQPATPGTPGGPGGNMNTTTPGAGPASLSLQHMPMHAPTAIKVVAPKDYFPEWKDHGFEEAVFLGACIMARVSFMQDTSQPASFMTRVQYNEEGPTGLHHYTLG